MKHESRSVLIWFWMVLSFETFYFKIYTLFWLKPNTYHHHDIMHRTLMHVCLFVWQQAASFSVNWISLLCCWKARIVYREASQSMQVLIIFGLIDSTCQFAGELRGVGMGHGANKYSLLMHVIKFESFAKFILNEKNPFICGSICLQYMCFIYVQERFYHHPIV